MHPFASWLWTSSIPSAMGGWEQDLSCPLLTRGARKSSFKQWEEAEALYSLPVPVLPWTHRPWVAGQYLDLLCPVIHCRVVLLPSDTCPLHRLHGQGISRNVHFPLYFGDIKVIMASARLFILGFFWLRASPFNVRILVGKPRVWFSLCSASGAFWPMELGLWDPLASFQLSRSDECEIWILMNIIMPQNFPKFYMLGPFQIFCKATHLEK